MDGRQGRGDPWLSAKHLEHGHSSTRAPEGHVGEESDAILSVIFPSAADGVWKAKKERVRREEGMGREREVRRKA